MKEETEHFIDLEKPYYYDSYAPERISEELLPIIQALNLEENCRQLAMEGWTIVHDAASPDFFARIRKVILEKCQNDQIYWLLHQDKVFQEAALNPVSMALAEFSVGRGFLLSKVNASIKRNGDPALPIRMDLGWLPDPLPVHNYLLTVCWVCDGDSNEAGGLTIIPGSHSLRRRPTETEPLADAGAVSIDAPPGSLILWDGNIWHGATQRKLDGERVGLHISYSRLALRAAEDYSAFADALIAEHGPRMSQLLGRDDFLGSNGVDYEKLRVTYNNAKR